MTTTELTALQQLREIANADDLKLAKGQRLLLFDPRQVDTSSLFDALRAMELTDCDIGLVRVNRAYWGTGPALQLLHLTTEETVERKESVE